MGRKTDVQATLRDSLGEDVEPYLILGACNPPLAHRALNADRRIGLLLPCNVVIRTEANRTIIDALDPQTMVAVAGAGLVMSTLDVVAYGGQEFGGIRPANFLDIGGGASAEVASGLDIVLSDPDVRSVLVNVFGGITSCDTVASGIVSAMALLAERGEPVRHPILVRLDGHNAAEGRRILQEAAIPAVEQVATMDDAARATRRLRR